MSARQLTSGSGGRILTNCNVWSADSDWIVFDTRTDAAGDNFDGTRIQMVHATSGEVRTVYESQRGACCGVATWHPREPKVAFILGPEHPTADWSYGASRRQGVIVDTRTPGLATNLDARDLVPPFTAGALRGGTHVHVWSADGQRVSFTYEDQVLAANRDETAEVEVNLRGVGVADLVAGVSVPQTHPRNHNGSHFSVLVTELHANPQPGSDQIRKAVEEGWIDRRRLAFQGQVVTAKGDTISEVFVVELPDDLRRPSEQPLAGTATKRPRPPRGTTQRRLTHTADRKHPGIQGPRHWLRASPDGRQIGVLMKDDAGIVQFWTVSPSGGELSCRSRLETGVASAFTWFADSQRVAFVSDARIAILDLDTKRVRYVTERAAIRPEACVVSPNNRQIAFVRRDDATNQICVAMV